MVNDSSEQSSGTEYDSHFFKAIQKGSYQSAQEIVPLILNWISPQSIVDVGCGDGTWLSVFSSYGVEDILGIDGDYIQQTDLQIPSNCFVAADLQQPLVLSRTFDLVVSLEVAEHLPENCADQFVNSLISLARVILFSAAIPHQGGTHHVNEQWPFYWVRRFEAYGYELVDVLRGRIWDNPRIEPWYAQNSLIFVKNGHRKDYPMLPESNPFLLAMVHPKIYLKHCSQLPYLTKEIEILSISFLPSTTITSGSGLIIIVEYQWHSKTEPALMNLSLTNTEGQIYLETDTTLPQPPGSSSLQTMQLKIERLDLVQGTYYINPGIFSADWNQTYDFQWHRHFIMIETEAPRKGIIHPPLQWHRSCDD